jgi:phosphopantothenoylcysteine decarboxylase / phosphopantothenate---cysteine ligase
MSKKQPREKLLSKKVLHILSGSIAAYKAPEISDKLRQSGCEVTCILTAAAKKFVTKDTLRALSGKPVYDDMWAVDSPHDVLHTALAESADLILVAPASADFLARASIGMADDLATCVLLAATCPVLWAPAMNDNMFRNPLTQANIERLKKNGHRFIDPIEGHLVCGRVALGHIAETETIIAAVMQTFTGKK